MTITTVVFDIGQVLIGWDPYRVWRTILTDQQIAEFVTDIDFFALNHHLDAGPPFTDVIADVARTWPHHAPTLQGYWDAFADSLTGPIPGSADIVAELDRRGLRLLALTNWSGETFHHAQRIALALGHMDDIMVSGRVGLAKPDPAIFHLLIDTYGLTPSQTLFIDDSAPNIAAAAGAGLHPVHFTTPAALREELTSLGVLGDGGPVD